MRPLVLVTALFITVFSSFSFAQKNPSAFDSLIQNSETAIQTYKNTPANYNSEFVKMQNDFFESISAINGAISVLSERISASEINDLIERRNTVLMKAFFTLQICYEGINHTLSMLSAKQLLMKSLALTPKEKQDSIRQLVAIAVQILDFSRSTKKEHDGRNSIIRAVASIENPNYDSDEKDPYLTKNASEIQQALLKVKATSDNTYLVLVEEFNNALLELSYLNDYTIK